jgi:hypothetical protein
MWVADRRWRVKSKQSLVGRLASKSAITLSGDWLFGRKGVESVCSESGALIHQTLREKRAHTGRLLRQPAAPSVFLCRMKYGWGWAWTEHWRPGHLGLRRSSRGTVSPVREKTLLGVTSETAVVCRHRTFGHAPLALASLFPLTATAHLAMWLLPQLQRRSYRFGVTHFSGSCASPQTAHQGS